MGENDRLDLARFDAGGSNPTVRFKQTLVICAATVLIVPKPIDFARCTSDSYRLWFESVAGSSGQTP